MEGGNVPHCLKGRGIMSGIGKCPGNMSREKCPDLRSTSFVKPGI